MVVQTILNVLTSFAQGRAVPLKTFQRLLCLMAAAASFSLLALVIAPRPAESEIRDSAHCRNTHMSWWA